MKYKHLETTVLASSLEPKEDGTFDFQANIKFEILPEIQGHTIPDHFRYPQLTFWNLNFTTTDYAVVMAQADEKGLAKLKEVYGASNVVTE